MKRTRLFNLTVAALLIVAMVSCSLVMTSCGGPGAAYQPPLTPEQGQQISDGIKAAQEQVTNTQAALAEAKTQLAAAKAAAATQPNSAASQELYAKLEKKVADGEVAVAKANAKLAEWAPVINRVGELLSQPTPLNPKDFYDVARPLIPDPYRTIIDIGLGALAIIFGKRASTATASATDLAVLLHQLQAVNGTPAANDAALQAKLTDTGLSTHAKAILNANAPAPISPP